MSLHNDALLFYAACVQCKVTTQSCGPWEQELMLCRSWWGTVGQMMLQRRSGWSLPTTGFASTHYITLERCRADLAKCRCIVGCCTCPAAVHPPLCASGQSALGLRAPRSRSPLYHLPTPPGSPAVWWTPASLVEKADLFYLLNFPVVLCVNSREHITTSTSVLLQNILHFSYLKTSSPERGA